MKDVVCSCMDRIELTDGLCRITFDPSTVKGLDLSPSGPNIKNIKDRSTKMPLASIGVENLGSKDIFTGPNLNAKGNAHFLRLINNLAPDETWSVRGIDVPGRFITGGPGWLAGGLGWHYVLITDKEAEAICAFAMIRDDCMCYVASIFHEGDDERISHIRNLIKSIQAK
jgi:hypothetical protein